MAKKKTPEQELETYRQDIIREREHWKDLNESGCNDPFWPDGVGLNLTRNHILYDRKKIKEICLAHNFMLPGEYYLPVPPEVDQNYMANLKQTERVERIHHCHKITTKKTKFEDGQLEML